MSDEKMHRKQQQQGFPGQKRAARLSLSWPPTSAGRLFSGILSGNNYSLISPQARDAFFHLISFTSWKSGDEKQ